MNAPALVIAGLALIASSVSAFASVRTWAASNRKAREAQARKVWWQAGVAGSGEQRHGELALTNGSDVTLFKVTVKVGDVVLEGAVNTERRRGRSFIADRGPVTMERGETWTFLAEDWLAPTGAVTVEFMDPDRNHWRLDQNYELLLLSRWRDRFAAWVKKQFPRA